MKHISTVISISSTLSPLNPLVHQARKQYFHSYLTTYPQYFFFNLFVESERQITEYNISCYYYEIVYQMIQQFKLKYVVSMQIEKTNTSVGFRLK